jgi:TonB family protein
MPKDFLKPLIWAISLHGGVLGILLFSWPFLTQSVFSMDRDGIIKVSLVSMDLASRSLFGEAPKNISSERPDKQKNTKPRTGSNQPARESNSPLGDSPIRSNEDQVEKKESGMGISFSPQAGLLETSLREKVNGGQPLPGGNSKDPLVALASTNKTVAGSTLAVPRYGQNREPYYPAAAREQGWQGTAVLKVLVLRNGTVGALEILRSSGHAILDRSALKAVKEWKFIPAQKDGLAIEIGVEVPVTFRLE